jgi:hypothetical protein
MHCDIEIARPTLSSDALIPFKEELFGEARLCREICDFDLFRQWLVFYETKYNHVKNVATSEMTIRLIDVYDLCIIEWQGPAAEAPRFLALSYIWGVVT